MTTPRSIRFPDDLLKKGEVLARVRGISFNKLVVEVLTAELDRVRSDPRVRVAIASMLDQLT